MSSLSRIFPLGSLALLVYSAPVWAGDVTITSPGTPVVVMRGAQMVGTTPVTLRDLAEGEIELGFRDAPLSATAFTQTVNVPAQGAVELDVNLPDRIATTRVAAPAPAAPPPGAPAAPTAAAPTAAAPPPVAPVAAPAPVEAPKPEVPSGDIYVTSIPAGASVFLDGAPTGAETPFMIRGVPVGKHTVDARTKCGRASSALMVVNKSIARAELTLVDRPGSLTVTSTVPNTRVFVDGVEVGKAPMTMKECACGKHSVALRAPGFIESVKTVSVLGYEPVNLSVTSPSIPTPAARASTAGRTVDVLLQKEEFGTLVLDVTPLETALSVDGIDIGVGPRSIDKIAAGPHSVAGVLDGYARKTVDVVVEPEALARVTLTLEKEQAIVLPPPPSMPARTHVNPLQNLDVPFLSRLALNAGVSVIGLGAGVYSATQFGVAGEAYQRYQTEPSDETAQAIYTEEVVPARVRAWVGGGLGLVGVIAASGLWITTEF